LPAPAKLNLMLRVVGRREDGYHLLQTVFQIIDLCDWVSLKSRDDGMVCLETPLAGVPPESDLTVRAARSLQKACAIDRGVNIRIEKVLPMGGGLGGGSSDAATVLVGLNHLWQAGLSVDELAKLGLGLGADVPVFVRGRSAWAEGVGERLQPIDLPESWYLVIVPGCQVSTAKVFGSPDLTRDNKPIKMRDFVAGQQDNHCLPVVTSLYPEVRDALAALARLSPARLTGTGACVFAAFPDRTAAETAWMRLGGSWTAFIARGVNRSPLYTVLDSALT
jgi:4-diphosphocytidyl-2-C-methyl-D-erythritol kinase